MCILHLFSTLYFSFVIFLSIGKRQGRINSWHSHLLAFKGSLSRKGVVKMMSCNNTHKHITHTHNFMSATMQIHTKIQCNNRSRDLGCLLQSSKLGLWRRIRLEGPAFLYTAHHPRVKVASHLPIKQFLVFLYINIWRAQFAIWTNCSPVVKVASHLSI